MSSESFGVGAKTQIKARDFTGQLDLFAREFPDEATLRKVLADLFWKMGHTGVRITHGPNEKGKDIVFYSQGPLDDSRLYACVVKNQPITGNMGDHSNGAPTIVASLQNVINQVVTAFSEPIPNESGTDEWIDSVYVISPYEAKPAAIESVKHQLQRSGQIAFFCGSRLMELFAKYWPQFLWFESGVLTSYLTALRKGLEENYALASLILQHPYLGHSGSSWLEAYVQPRFHRDMMQFSLADDIDFDLGFLSKRIKYYEVEDFLKSSARIAKLLSTTTYWTNEPEKAPIEKDIKSVQDLAKTLWEARKREYFATLVRPRRKRSEFGFAASGAFQISDEIEISEREIQVTLAPTDSELAAAMQVKRSVEQKMAELKRLLGTVASLSNSPTISESDVLRRTDFLSFCQIYDASRHVPQILQAEKTGRTLTFQEDLLDSFEGSLLITGPAGFGKTTFCKWNSIRDANRLVEKKSTILPVYRALHPLSRGTLGSFEEVFFHEESLNQLIQQQAAGQTPFSKIRLYLDGLDEVTSIERQEQIVERAREMVTKWSFVQVIVTARDHVVSSSLKWLPRVTISELDEAKVILLAERWLEKGDIDEFFTKLRSSGRIEDLMKIPLLATLILAVFKKTKSVPPNKTRLYSLFVDLLSGGWDFYKNIQRRNSRFGMRDKEVVLARLAGILHNNNKRDAKEADFRAAVRNSIEAFHGNWESLLQEIVEDGLLVKVGGILTFSHLSFQEFLAARDLQDPMGTRPTQALRWYLSGKDWWKEVLAFFVTFSDRPNETEEWIVKTANSSTRIPPDIIERVNFLRQEISFAFPAFGTSKACATLLDEFTSSAKRFRDKNED